jgi:hypothetical protein
MDSSTNSVGDILFHKEKKQKKNNITTGHIDNLRGYHDSGNTSTDKFATDDKQIAREARIMANVHIDIALERLRSVGLLNEGYDAWYCKVMHTIGVAKMEAMANTAMDRVRPGSTPSALFHFLINKEFAKATDPYMPRFNRKG